MEDVLEVYHRPVDPARPLVCFDESGKELQQHVRLPQPGVPGRPARIDTTYKRGGMANLFLACAPHQGWRDVLVTARRTAIDFAQALRTLVDQHFPDAERIVLVTDNLNTHKPAALYQTFPPAEARRIAARIEWHYTPTHGSWLNMAELELSALARQCLDRRLPDAPTLAQEVAAWVADRNTDQVHLTWTFGIAEARRRLAHCYPTPEQDT
jgi:hypothetical protein